MVTRTYSGSAPSRRSITEPLITQQQEAYKTMDEQTRFVSDLNLQEQQKYDAGQTSGQFYDPIQYNRTYGYTSEDPATAKGQFGYSGVRGTVDENGNLTGGLTGVEGTAGVFSGTSRNPGFGQNPAAAIPTSSVGSGITSGAAISKFAPPKTATASVTDKADAAARAKGAELKNLGIFDPTLISAAENEARKGVYDAANFESQRQNDRLQQSKLQQEIAGMLGQQNQVQVPDKQAETGMTDQGQVLPDVAAAYQGLQDALNAGDLQAAQMASQEIGNLLNDTSVKDFAEGAKEDLKTFIGQRQDISDRTHDIALDREAEIKRQQEEQLATDRARFELDQALQESQLRSKNIENEQRNRRVAAALGVNHDTNGLKWMAEEERKGTELLTYLQNSANITRKSFADSARQIGESYRLASRQADINYDTTNLQIETDLKNGLADLTNTVSLDAKERRNAVKDILNTYFKNKSDSDIKRAEIQKDIRIKSMEMIDAAQKENAKNIIKTGDSLKFIGDLRDRIESKEWYKKSKDATFSYGAMEAAWNRYMALDPQTRNRIGVDNAMITAFSKMLDPGSVVRESEYARVPENASLLNRLYGAAERALSGGAGLTEQDLQEMYDTATAVKDSYDQQVLKNLQPYLMEVDTFNSQDKVQSPVDYNQILDLDIPLPEQHYMDLETLYGSSDGMPSYNTNGTENPTAVAGYLPPENAPPMGYRTDRHNNPTAFTIDVAKQAGLKEGVDYVYDEQLANGFPTAKLLGDPIETSIRVIDNIGFYTQGGKQRWTHTAMNKKDWDSMTKNQKAQVVLSMYQKEGGSGMLAQGRTPANSIAMVPTASAAEAPMSPPIASAAPKAIPTVTPGSLMGTGQTGGGSGLTGRNGPSLSVTKSGQKFRTADGGIISVPFTDQETIALYKSMPDRFTPIE